MRSRVAVASVWTTGHPTPVSARTVPQVYIQCTFIYLKLFYVDITIIQ